MHRRVVYYALMSPLWLIEYEYVMRGGTSAISRIYVWAMRKYYAHNFSCSESQWKSVCCLIVWTNKDTMSNKERITLCLNTMDPPNDMWYIRSRFHIGHIISYSANTHNLLNSTYKDASSSSESHISGCTGGAWSCIKLSGSIWLFVKSCDVDPKEDGMGKLLR